MKKGKETFPQIVGVGSQSSQRFHRDHRDHREENF